MASLPSILPAKPAIRDTTTTPEQINKPFGKVTTPELTPIYICALDKCYRLLPSHRVLMAHRKKDHETDDDSHIITWNSPGPSQISQN